MEKPFGLMLEALDDLHHNEVYVNTGSSPRNALWGELMSTRARKLGSRGAVLNGYVRDTKAILNMGFPTFGFGSYGQDSAPRYKVVDYRIPVEIGSGAGSSGRYFVGRHRWSSASPRRGRDRGLLAGAGKSSWREVGEESD
jgi:regulator of RNase E activity RraA